MVPPSWNDRGRVGEFIESLATSDTATAVAVSILDVCQPATRQGPEYYAHWALPHFLLDGHHKMEAAAASGQSLRLEPARDWRGPSQRGPGSSGSSAPLPAGIGSSSRLTREGVTASVRFATWLRVRSDSGRDGHRAAGWY